MWGSHLRPRNVQGPVRRYSESGPRPWSLGARLRGSSGSGTRIVRSHVGGRGGSLCHVSFSASPVACSSHPCLLLHPLRGGSSPHSFSTPLPIPSTPHAHTAHCPPPRPTSAPHSWACLRESCFSAPNTACCLIPGAAGLLLLLPSPGWKRNTALPCPSS